MRPRREVWIVSNVPPPVHGVSAFNATLIESMERHGVRHRIFRIGTRGTLDGIEQLSAAKSIADVGSLAELSFSALRAAARGRRRSTVIYFTPSQHGAAILRDAAVAQVARSAGIPLVAHVHGCQWLDVWSQGGPGGRLMFEAVRSCERVICLGPTYAARFAAATGLPSIGINNGVLAPSAATVRRTPGRGERVELLYLSNFIRSKGLWTAANATRELGRRGIAVRLRCAGAWMLDHEREDFLATFAAELRSGAIELVGFATGAQKEELFRSSHFFLLPTAYPPEGQPLSLIEAMASGLVPITTRQGGIGDLLDFDHEETLASPRHLDPIEVANSVSRLVSGSEQLERASAQCIARHRNALTAEACTRAVLDVLQHGFENG